MNTTDECPHLHIDDTHSVFRNMENKKLKYGKKCCSIFKKLKTKMMTQGMELHISNYSSYQICMVGCIMINLSALESLHKTNDKYGNWILVCFQAHLKEVSTYIICPPSCSFHSWPFVLCAEPRWRETDHRISILLMMYFGMKSDSRL